MEYFKLPPSNRLKNHVQYYWILMGDSGDKGLEKQRIIPDGNVGLFFHFGDCYARYDQKGFLTHEDNRLGVSGHLKKNTFIRPKGKTGILGVRFRPQNTYELLKIPISEITDDMAHPNDVTLMADPFLEEKLLEAPNLETRIHTLETFLQLQLSRRGEKDLLIEKLVDGIITNGGKFKEGPLLDHLNISRRQLNRNFGQKVGINLKLMSRIVRLRTLIRDLKCSPECSLTRLAYQYDFYDQAHFNRDFKQLIGISPSVFLTEKNPIAELLIDR